MPVLRIRHGDPPAPRLWHHFSFRWHSCPSHMGARIWRQVTVWHHSQRIWLRSLWFGQRVWTRQRVCMCRHSTQLRRFTTAAPSICMHWRSPWTSQLMCRCMGNRRQSMKRFCIRWIFTQHGCLIWTSIWLGALCILCRTRVWRWSWALLSMRSFHPQSTPSISCSLRFCCNTDCCGLWSRALCTVCSMRDCCVAHFSSCLQILIQATATMNVARSQRRTLLTTFHADCNVCFRTFPVWLMLFCSVEDSIVDDICQF